MGMTDTSSKRTKISDEAVYRFGDFILNPTERRLTRGAGVLPLQPKALDTLILLVRHAGHLVSKAELLATIWPRTHVSEANLTNTIVALRKTLGSESIRTLSKHGYRFEIPLLSEPGVDRATYENFLKAREIIRRRSLEEMPFARDLLMLCLAENPTFAQAWAWLGRCCLFLYKFSNETAVASAVADAALQRALLLSPDLNEAHQFLTLRQVDNGQTGEAVVRLLLQVQKHCSESENYVGLVQAYRFEGLLQESIHAHERSVELDPTVSTSVAHTFFLLGDFAAAVEAYAGRSPYYLDAAAWSALGLTERAAGLLRRRLQTQSLSPMMWSLLSSLLAVLDGDSKSAVRIMGSAEVRSEPEVLLYFARHYSRLGLVDEARATLRSAAKAGFVCAPETLQDDPWFGSLREAAHFDILIEEARSTVTSARLRYGVQNCATKRALATDRPLCQPAVLG